MTSHLKHFTNLNYNFSQYRESIVYCSSLKFLMYNEYMGKVPKASHKSPCLGKSFTPSTVKCDENVDIQNVKMTQLTLP